MHKTNLGRLVEIGERCNWDRDLPLDRLLRIEERYDERESNDELDVREREEYDLDLQFKKIKKIEKIRINVPKI